jgi:hypothetical protein
MNWQTGHALGLPRDLDPLQLSSGPRCAYHVLHTLRDPGEASHGAVRRSTPDVITADSALQFSISVRRDRARFDPFSKVKFGR